MRRATGSADVPSDGPYYAQRYVMDEHTGTHTDFPPNFIPPPGSGLLNQGSAGLLTGDKFPLDRMMGPAVVIDVTSLLDQAQNGRSPVIELSAVKEWERKNGEIQAGDIVLLRTGYVDKYYKPFPAGMRVTLEPVVLKTKPGWPSPSVDLMEYLHKKPIFHMGTDGASMGPSEGGQAVHVAGLKYGMCWEEMLTGLGKLPARRSYYLALPLRIAGQSGSPVRAVAFVPRKRS